LYTFIQSAKTLNFSLNFSALTLLAGQKEWHPACKKTECWYVGGGDLTGVLQASEFRFAHYHLQHIFLH